jgi:hypothetical protein
VSKQEPRVSGRRGREAGEKHGTQAARDGVAGTSRKALRIERRGASVRMLRGDYDGLLAFKLLTLIKVAIEVDFFGVTPLPSKNLDTLTKVSRIVYT